MLILSRKIGEKVVVAKEIYCTILDVSGNRVRLGFEAPYALPIHREEIHNRIALANEGAFLNDDDVTMELIAHLNPTEQQALATH